MLGAAWPLLARVELLAKKALALDTKSIRECEVEKRWTLQLFTCINTPAPDNLYAAFPAQWRKLQCSSAGLPPFFSTGFSVLSSGPVHSC